MGVYDNFVATAKRMINKYGGLVTINREVAGTQDADEPWKRAETSVLTKPDIKCGWFSPTLRTMKNAGIEADTDVPNAYYELYIAQIPGFEIMSKDTITKWDGSVWKIVYLDKINPNGEGVILYDIIVQQ